MRKVIKGDLYRRVKLNRRRLKSKMYTYPEVFLSGSKWPGDHEGRCILSLTSLYFGFYGHEKERESVFNQLREIIDHLDEYTNKDHYFGPLVNDEFIDEQQVSGNSWYLRGLIEYYQITKDDKILKNINSVINNFIYKIAKFYEHYPLVNREMGGVGGHLEGKLTDGWLTSSDIGCAFIMLDSISEAYYLTRDKKLESILKMIIDKFINIDFLALSCQTHATLSCARGVLTYFEASHDEKYFNYAKDIFNKYIKYGMTKDYSNINWFNRSDTWTEPCCIVDSFILASKFYCYTSDYEYAKLANRIYLDAFRMAQRSNGGAGCNTCLYDDKNTIHGYLYEAYFCCTMRLAEGFRFVKKYSAILKDNVLEILLLQDFKILLCDGASLDIKGDIYNKEKVVLNFKNIKKKYLLKIYIPSNTKFNVIGEKYKFDNGFLILEINKDAKIIINFELGVHSEDQVNFAGDMVLVKRGKYINDKVFIINNEKYYYLIDYSLVNGKSNCLNLEQEL